MLAHAPLLAQTLSPSVEYNNYLKSNFDYFAEAKEAEFAEYNGYFYLLHARYEEAITSMKKALDEDPQNENIKQELANTLVLKKRYAEAASLLEYEEQIQNPIFNFLRYPRMAYQIKANRITLPFFEDYYTNCSINGVADTLFLDTGVRVTLMSRSYAQKHGIRIDSLDMEETLTGNAYQSQWDSGLIPRISLGDSIILENVPCFIVEDGVFTQFGIRNQLVFGLDFLMLFDQVEFDYAEQQFIASLIEDRSAELRPNFHLLGLTPVTSVALSGERVNAFIDTGSPSTYIYESERFNAGDREPSKTVEKEFRGYAYTDKYYAFAVKSGVCWNGQMDLKIRASRNTDPEYKKDLLIGNETWLEGSLLLDFKHNYCCFQTD